MSSLRDRGLVMNQSPGSITKGSRTNMQILSMVSSKDSLLRTVGFQLLFDADDDLVIECPVLGFPLQLCCLSTSSGRTSFVLLSSLTAGAEVKIIFPALIVDVEDSAAWPLSLGAIVFPDFSFALLQSPGARALLAAGHDSALD